MPALGSPLWAMALAGGSYPDILRTLWAFVFDQLFQKPDHRIH